MAREAKAPEGVSAAHPKNETAQKPKAVRTTTYAAKAAAKPTAAAIFKKAVQAKAKDPEKKDDLLKLLIRAPRQESAGQQEVLSTTFSVNLTMKARGNPTLAWKTMVEAVCGEAPLQVSLHEGRQRSSTIPSITKCS